MTPERFDETKSESIARLREMMETRVGKVQAEEALIETMERKTAAGEILLLTEEEERLLGAFRAFKATFTESRVVFKWRTGPIAEATKEPLSS